MSIGDGVAGDRDSFYVGRCSEESKLLKEAQLLPHHVLATRLREVPEAAPLWRT